MFGLKEELLHPMILHFPLVFLLCATAIFLVSLFPLKEQLKGQLEVLFNFQFYLGLFLMWPTIFLGEISGDKLRPSLSDVTVLSRHEQLGEQSLYFYISAAIILLFLEFGPIKKLLHKRAFTLAVAVLLVAGSVTLIQSAELGGEMVYGEQE